MQKARPVKLSFKMASGVSFGAEFPVYDGESTFETYITLPGNENKTEADFFEHIQGKGGDGVVKITLKEKVKEPEDNRKPAFEVAPGTELNTWLIEKNRPIGFNLIPNEEEYSEEELKSITDAFLEDEAFNANIKITFNDGQYRGEITFQTLRDIVFKGDELGERDLQIPSSTWVNDPNDPEAEAKKYNCMMVPVTFKPIYELDMGDVKDWTAYEVREPVKISLRKIDTDTPVVFTSVNLFASARSTINRFNEGGKFRYYLEPFVPDELFPGEILEDPYGDQSLNGSVSFEDYKDHWIMPMAVTVKESPVNKTSVVTLDPEVKLIEDPMLSPFNLNFLIKGKVTDSEGKPIANALIKAIDTKNAFAAMNGFECWTKEDGTFYTAFGESYRLIKEKTYNGVCYSRIGGREVNIDFSYEPTITVKELVTTFDEDAFNEDPFSPFDLSMSLTSEVIDFSKLKISHNYGEERELVKDQLMEFNDAETNGEEEPSVSFIISGEGLVPEQDISIEYRLDPRI